MKGSPPGVSTLWFGADTLVKFTPSLRTVCEEASNIEILSNTTVRNYEAYMSISWYMLKNTDDLTFNNPKQTGKENKSCLWHQQVKIAGGFGMGMGMIGSYRVYREFQKWVGVFPTVPTHHTQRLESTFSDIVRQASFLSGYRPSVFNRTGQSQKKSFMKEAP